MVVRFEELNPGEPDLDAWQARVDGWVQRIGAAAGPETVIECVWEWDAAVREVSTWSAWALIRYCQDTRDPDAIARNTRLDELGPRLQALDMRLKRAVLDSPHLPAVTAALGPQAVALWSLDRQSQDESLVESQVQEATLASEYAGLVGGAQVAFRGQTLGIPRLTAFLEDEDRSIRHEAALALWGWYAAHAEPIGGIYRRLVALRDGMARSLGEPDFVQLGYRQMRRRGFGPAEVAAFRDELRTHVLPVVARLRRAQARRLGLPSLKVWDLRVLDRGGNPRPDPDPTVQVSQAEALFARLGLSEFFGTLQASGVMDLESRPGKRPGGFCHFLPSVGLPFVFANLNGTTHDTKVFTHELGHALQVWSSRGAPLMDLVWPTYDAAEVHSMSLELLTWPHMDLFYGAAAGRYRRDHLSSAIAALPWLAALDELQHRVYQQPQGDVDAMWREIEAAWEPDIDWGDLPHGPQGRRWQAVPHLFSTPFYMIDYALAQTCALQLWSLARRDPEEAMRRYLALCRIGGQAPFLELMQGAGLRSPFEPGLLGTLMAEVEQALDELEGT